MAERRAVVIAPVPRHAEHFHAPYIWAARAAPSEDLRKIIYGRS